MMNNNFNYKRLVRNLRNQANEKNLFQPDHNNKQNSEESSTIQLLKKLQLNSFRTKE